jgi:hypothetical protein
MWAISNLPSLMGMRSRSIPLSPDALQRLERERPNTSLGSYFPVFSVCTAAFAASAEAHLTR